MADDAVITKNSEHAVTEEADSGSATALPGHLVEAAADGSYAEHDTAAGAAGPVFAGLPFDPDKDKADTYASGERMRLHFCAPGVHVDALSGAAITDGAYVVSNGDGSFRDLDTVGGDSVGAAVGIAHEGTAGADERFTLEVL